MPLRSTAAWRRLLCVCPEFALDHVASRGKFHSVKQRKINQTNKQNSDYTGIIVAWRAVWSRNQKWWNLAHVNQIPCALKIVKGLWYRRNTPQSSPAAGNSLPKHKPPPAHKTTLTQTTSWTLTISLNTNQHQLNPPPEHNPPPDANYIHTNNLLNTKKPEHKPHQQKQPPDHKPPHQCKTISTQITSWTQLAC